MIGEKSIDRYGDPFDDSSPRNRAPMDRVKEFNLSLEDQVRYLTEDVDILMGTVGSLVRVHLEQTVANARKAERRHGEPGDGGYL